MTRLPTLLLLTMLLVAPTLAQERHTSPESPYASPVAPSYEHLLDRERLYTVDPETGKIARSPEARARAEAHLPQPERVRRAAPPPTIQRGGATIYTVNSAFDAADDTPGDGLCATFFGDCTLRAALEETNATPGTDPVIIEFAITSGPFGSFDPATEAWTIPVNATGLGAFPIIARSDVTIDGETQSGASCGLLPVGMKHDLNVVLDGSRTTSGDGLAGLASGFTVRGLVIQGFAPGFGTGLSFAGPNSLAECNYVGTDVGGEMAAPNWDGVFAGSLASNMVIRDNVVSGNHDDGITILGTFQTVQGNFVGTDDDGNQVLGNFDDGIIVSGSDGLIDGNLVSGNGDNGILLESLATRMKLTNNTVGLDRLRGNSGYGNGDDGIKVAGASDNDIGLPGGVNYIASNAQAGIRIGAAGANGNRVRNNVVGLDLSGNAQPNRYGIYVSAGPEGTAIGLGPDGNLVAGNLEEGLFLGAATNTHVENNTVGLNAAGTARGNGADGIRLSEASGVVLRNNVVSSNEGSGVALTGSGPFITNDVVVEGNRIGLAPDGTARGNGADGVLCLGATDVRIGGTETGQPNTIAFNGQSNPDADGVFLADTCTDVALVRNSIHSNAGLGIDRCPSFPSGCDAVTPNDSPDADGITNYPVIMSVENDGTDATLTLSFNGLPNQGYRIGFFRSDTPDPSGFGEGRTFVFAQQLTTDASGQASLVLKQTAGFFPLGSWVSATATPFSGFPVAYGSTSEFSQAVQVEDTSGPAYDLVATNTSPLTVAPGGAVSFDYSITNNTASAATGNLWFVAERAGSTVAQGVIRFGPLPGSVTISGSYTQAVPATTPTGPYTYRLRIGQFPSPTVDEEVFMVTVTGSARPGTAETWPLADVTPWTEVGADASEAASLETALPMEAALVGAYPNPFSRSATVAFAMSSTQRVRLAVYDVLGREVARLVEGAVEGGRHEAVLDGAALPAGVYLVRLVTDARTETQRLTLVR